MDSAFKAAAERHLSYGKGESACAGNRGCSFEKKAEDEFGTTAFVRVVPKRSSWVTRWT